jgi:protein involved in polysaccharide export with SLBB domain
MGSEAMDNRLKTVADVKRVTGLPVVTSAGDLSRLTQGQQDNWAFRAWTSVQGLLSPSPNQGFVCGITSSEHGEGRSTWVRLLADAASRRGFRVLTIIAGEPSHNGHGQVNGNGHAKLQNKHAAQIGAGSEAQDANDSGALVRANGAAHSVLAKPDDVTELLTGPNPEPVVQIPLPGWVWNLERRKQWQAALSSWSEIDNIALLVELPPASMPETVLLAENLPNLLWLADARQATADATREQLQTLRHARCHLAGAVLNHAPVSRWHSRLARWFGCLVLGAGLGALPVQAQVQGAAAAQVVFEANTNLSFSVVTPAQRAAWQRKLTLGPGDVLTIALHGEPTLTRVEMPIGPDGRISFAEAQDVLATGLTIDELRVRMNEELGKFRRAPETMITPVAFRSKKYFMLGKVMMKGIYTLDRPTTVLEAVARARGFETGLVDRNIITVADFSRSFLMRGGKRYPLNFENLFQNGDLSQNLGIEPGDYIYFPASNVKEVYVLGEVRLPGPAVYTPDLTVAGAIAARSGYTDAAWKGHILVVRGSLNNPQTFVVNLKDIVAGKTLDFRLQPKDIVFVNSRPFIYGEELLHLAITAFLQSIVTATVGENLIKPFRE